MGRQRARQRRHSVALLRLLLERSDLSLTWFISITKPAAPNTPAMLISSAAWRNSISLSRSRCEVTSNTPIEKLPANTSSRYRAIRLALFNRVVAENSLFGVILAHHADDQAETVLHRLLRGSGPMGIAAMQPETKIDGLRILRPLLDCRGVALRDYLSSIGQTWPKTPAIKR